MKSITYLIVQKTQTACRGIVLSSKVASLVNFVDDTIFASEVSSSVENVKVKLFETIFFPTTK